MSRPLARALGAELVVERLWIDAESLRSAPSVALVLLQHRLDVLMLHLGEGQARARGCRRLARLTEVEGQVLALDGIAARQSGALDDQQQLACVAWPRIVLQRVERLRGDALLGSEAREEVP